MKFVLEVDVPSQVAPQVAGLLEKQHYTLAPAPGRYGYVVPSEGITVIEVKTEVAA